jgi:hypothetical protein
MDAAEWRLVAVLSIPHVLYAFIWFAPKAFQALCGKTDAVDVFAALAAALKGACRDAAHVAYCEGVCSRPAAPRGCCAWVVGGAWRAAASA